jgi:hypothetical protein
MAAFGKAGERCQEEDFQRIIDDMADQIMYCKADWKELWSRQNYDGASLGYVDAIEKCAVWIAENDEYRKFDKDFKNHLKIPLLFAKIRDRLNKFYEDRFIDNDLDSIFPATSHTNHKEGLENEGFAFEEIDDEKDRRLLLDNIDDLVKTLPFFEMCEKFGEYLKEYAYSERSSYVEYRMNFSTLCDPFSLALGRLSETTLINKVSPNFSSKYFAGYKVNSGYSTFFPQFISIDENKEGVVVASNWLKLAYYYLDFKPLAYESDYENLFKHFIFGNSGEVRGWAKRLGADYGEIGFNLCPPNHKVYRNDRWTQRILKDIYGFQYET